MKETTARTTRKLRNDERIPYELLLLADETIAAIDKYIHHSEVYILEQDGQMIAVYALYPLNKNEAEIKNIAVSEDHQGQGVGQFLLKDAEIKAKEKGFQKLIIGTPDVAVKQLAIYKKAGFEAYAIKKDFFVINYTEPIIENGIRLRDMMMLRKCIG